MADKAREATDKRLAVISKRLKHEYNGARNDLTKKLTNYLANADKRLNALSAALSAALKTGDAGKIAAAKEALYKAKLNITLNDKRYREMIDDLTDRLADVNQTALQYVNGQMPYIYRQNYNGAKEPAAEVGMSFSLMNEEAVARRVAEGDIKLPKKKVDIPKDKRWNTKKLNSAVLQGIIQGESMRDIAKRILPIVDNNRDAAIRNARTMVTGAENEGRLDGFHKLEEEGAVLKKVWIATPDSRTREAHLFLDGQEVGVDEPFVDEDGNELMYPGDPSAAPETVYNCRCSMRTHIVGFRKADGEVEYIKTSIKEGVHEKQIEAEREKREAEEPKPKEKSFAESLIGRELSPHIRAYTKVEDYWQAKKDFGAEPTRYVDDMFEYGKLTTVSDWRGYYSDKIPKIEATIAQLNDEYPLPTSGDREYGVHLSKLVVCDYDAASLYLPDGENDRRFSPWEASAQVFENDNQVVMAFNRPFLTDSIQEVIEERDTAIRSEKVLSTIGGGCPEITAIHEWGHIMSDHLDSAMIYQDETVMEYWNWYKGLSKDEIRKGLSDYATANRGEFEAECFAELHMPNPRPLALKFKEYLDAVIKKGY